MKFNHILMSIFLGSSIFFTFTLMYAPSEVQKLQDYSQSLENNNIQLRAHGNELENIYYQLRDNPESIIAEAYRIGFIFSDYSMIQVHPRERKVKALSAGEHVRIINIDSQYKNFFRNISIVVALLIIFIQLAFSIKNKSALIQKNISVDSSNPSVRE